VYATTAIDVLTDFSYQLTLEYPSGNTNDQYGLMFGSIPANTNFSTDPVEYFTINNDQKMYMGNRTWYSFYTELSRPAILQGGKNTLKVLKKGTMLYYFINDVYSYCSEAEVTSSGTKFGFLVPPKGTVWVDNLILSEKIGTTTARNVKQIKQVEFNTQTTGKFESNNVNDQ